MVRGGQPEMKIERFEDIEAWKAARELVRDVYQVSRNERFERDFGLRDQVRRAAVSVMANIAEGFDGRSAQEFIRFLGYAFRSTTEVQSHLYVALDQSYILRDDFDRLYRQAVTAKKLINGFIKYLGSIEK
jgi:four helix bundle protein